jgi:hypothetical protein
MLLSLDDSISRGHNIIAIVQQALRRGVCWIQPVASTTSGTGTVRSSRRFFLPQAAKAEWRPSIQSLVNANRTRRNRRKTTSPVRRLIGS